VHCNKTEAFLMLYAVTVQSLNFAREALTYKQAHFPVRMFWKYVYIYRLSAKVWQIA